MELQERLDRAGAAYDRKVDALVTIRPFKHGLEDFVPGRVFEPDASLSDRVLARMVSTKFLTVLVGGKGKVVDELPAAPTDHSLPVFACSAKGCARSFNTKLKLASHGKAHKD